MPDYAVSWENPKIKKDINNVVKLIDFIIENHIRKIDIDLLSKNSILIVAKLPREINEKESIIHICISNETIKHLKDPTYVVDKTSLNVEVHSTYQLLPERCNSKYCFDKILSIPKNNDGSKVYTYVDVVELHFSFFSDLTPISISLYNNYINNNKTRYIL